MFDIETLTPMELKKWIGINRNIFFENMYSLLRFNT